MKRHYILIIFFTISILSLAKCQTLNAYAKGAQEAFEKKDYYTGDRKSVV